MGTSATLSSPKGRIPFEKGWLDTMAEENGMPPIPTSNTQAELAPRGRFQSTKINLGTYLDQEPSQRDDELLKRALGKYSEKGMGGASCITEQMWPTAGIAEKLVTLLETLCNGSDPEISDWATQLTDKDLAPGGIVDGIINRLLPSTGGSIDETSWKSSLARALLSFIPEISLLDMTIGTVAQIAESFVTREICNQVYRSVAELFERIKSPLENSFSAIAVTERMRSYIQTKLTECIQAQEYDPVKPGLDTETRTNIYKKIIEDIFKALEAEV